MRLRQEFSIASIICICSIVVLGCAKKIGTESPSSRIGLTEEQLIAEQGPPRSAALAHQRPNAKILEYADATSYQIENKRVVASGRPPTKDEQNLQLWRHSLKTHKQFYEPSPSHAGSTSPLLYQLRAPKAGKTILYDPRADQVIKIIEYAPQ